MTTNRGQGTRRPFKRCERCREWYYPTQRYAKAKYCSVQCSTKARPRASRVAAGRKGGEMRAATFGLERREVLLAKLAGKTALEGYVIGRDYTRHRLGNRIQVAKREGYAEGYEAALKDSRPTGK